MSDVAIHEICLTVGGIAGLVAACFIIWCVTRDQR